MRATADGQETLVEGGLTTGTLNSADHQAVHHLTPATACGRDARDFVRERLCSWGWPEMSTTEKVARSEGISSEADSELAQINQDMQDILLLTSELAINAAEHAHSPMDVKVEYWPGRLVRVEVHDEGKGKPEARWPAEFEETGRGLALVELLSEAWGVIDCDTGKTVWFEFRLH
jgi:anti-sigma regulatory factor (Ser/Thr protein kinase)